jgi:dUTP pyrophosphatase
MNNSVVRWTTPEGVKYEVRGNVNRLEVNFKKLSPDAVTPSYATEGDAGLDLVSVSMNEDDNSNYIEYGTGIAVEIPKGYVGFLYPRSSVSKKENFYLKNSVGVIDSSYRGEIKLRFNKSDDSYHIGEKIGQLIILPYPTITLNEVSTLSNSERGIGGFGSTDVSSTKQ